MFIVSSISIALSTGPTPSKKSGAANVTVAIPGTVPVVVPNPVQLTASKNLALTGPQAI